MTTPHGSAIPGTQGVPRANHVVEGAPSVTDEVAAAAAAQDADDRGRVLYQTAGLRPGWYLMDGTGGLVLFAGTTSDPKNNLGAIVAPTATDDDSVGYSVGSHWIDTVTSKVWVCISAATGAAVWVDTTDTVTTPARNIQIYTSGPVTVSPTVDVYLIDATAGDIVVNLPVGVDGAEYTVKKIDASANTVTVTPNGAETVDGAPTKVLASRNTSIPVMFRTNWWIL